MRNASGDPDVTTWWEWCSLVVYFGLAITGATWACGAWTIEGLVNLLR